MADRTRFEMCTKEQCAGDAPHGNIVLATGEIGPPSYSKEWVRLKLPGGVKQGVISADEAALVLADIEASSLPEAMTKKDRIMQQLFSVPAQDFLAGMVADLVLEGFGTSTMVAREGRVVVVEVEVFHTAPRPATVNRLGFDVSMPSACPNGCHPVTLYRDGRAVVSGTTRDAKEARDLVNGWAKKYAMGWFVTRRVRTKVVEKTAEYNAELARFGKQK